MIHFISKMGKEKEKHIDIEPIQSCSFKCESCGQFHHASETVIDSGKYSFCKKCYGTCQKCTKQGKRNICSPAYFLETQLPQIDLFKIC